MHHTASTSLPSSNTASWWQVLPRETTYTPSHPHDLQVIHQTRPIFFHGAGVQFRCSLAHCFGQWTEVSMGTLTGLHLFSPIRNKLWCTLYSIYALVAVGSNHMGQLLFPVYISEPWLPMTLSGSPNFLPWTTFDRCWPLQARNTPQEWQHWRYSDFVIEPAQFSPFQTLSNPYITNFSSF